MKKQLKTTLFLLLCLFSLQLMAQEREVSGTVIDKDGLPLPGVNVFVENTSIGTVTDFDGKFNLQVPDKANNILVFSSVGFSTQKIELGNQTDFQITMKIDAEGLDEVVVVGYGTKKKINLTGSVSIVKGEELTKRQVASTSLALQGLAPGVTVTQQSGLPGDDRGNISIRGVSSMFAGQSPLVLVDNIEMSLDAIDPNNIESISILKDAASASIYGSRAANGVILITTKRGTVGKTVVKYNGYLGLQSPTNLPEKVGPLQHMRLYDEASVNVGKGAPFENMIADYEKNGIDNFLRHDTDWENEILTNNGLIQSHNITVNSGTEKLKMFGSGSYLVQNGLTENTKFERFDLRFNMDAQLFDKLTGSFDLVINTQDRQWPGGSSPNFIIRQMIGLPRYLPGIFENGKYGEAWNNRNPIAQARDSGFDRSKTNSTILTGKLDYKPFEGMDIFATYSANNWRPHNKILQRQYQVYIPDEVSGELQPGSLYPGTNSLTESRNEYFQNIFRVQGTFKKEFNKLHEFELLGGFSTEEYEGQSLTGFRSNLINQDLPYLNIGDASTMTNSGGISQWSMVSFYSRINYQYDEKYLLELNGRWDASSRFSKGNRWGFFPSMSAGWRVSQEDFWESVSNIFQETKIRASYGILGNQNLNSYYPFASAFDAGYNYFFNNQINSGYALADAANNNITWEESSQVDIGIDLAMLERRLSLTADYFKRDINNLIQRLPIPLTVGLGAPFVNAGSMTNEGWELALNWKDQINEFKYGASFNISDVKNKVTNLSGEEYISGNTIIREGYPINSYYGYIAEGYFQSEDEIEDSPFQYANTKPGDIIYRDISGPNGEPDGVIDNNDRAVLGNSLPRYEYSLNLNAQYHGFDLTVFFQGIGKRDNYLSGTGAFPFFSSDFQGTIYKHQLDYWTPENTNAAYPRLTVDIDNNYVNSNFWIRSGSYLRLKNVVLGYTLPSSFTDRFNIDNLRLYVSGQNLITWDNFYPGFDPEITNSNGEFYPIMKTFNLGLNIKI